LRGNRIGGPIASMTGLLCSIAALLCASDVEAWRFSLAIDEGVALPFEVEFDTTTARTTIVNGSERIDIPSATRDANTWQLDFAHFDSHIELALDAERVWRGTWTKRRSADEVAEVPVFAVPSFGERFEPVEGLSLAPEAFAGRWRVTFAGSDARAVALFEAHADGTLTGTFRTETGDHRFLAGGIVGDALRLSCFDGAHAFRYDARLVDGALTEGVFRSGDWYTESWSAVRDDTAELADPLALAGERSDVLVPFLELPAADGTWRHLWTPGRPALIEVFGSWCPNCHDAAALLQDLAQRFGPRGLDVVGVAFELTGDFARDAAQLTRFAQHTGVTYPLLLAGTADKARAAAALGLTERIVAFPTTLFVDASGAIVAVWSGFDGPATGAAHTKLCEDTERLVLDLLASRARAPLDARLAFERGDWLRPPLPTTADLARARFEFAAAYPTSLTLVTDLVLPNGIRPLRQLGTVGGATFDFVPKERSARQTNNDLRLVARVDALVDTRDLVQRWPLADERECELLPEQGAAALALPDPLLRAEGAFALAFAADELALAAPAQLVAALTDTHAWVRAHAAAALARLGPVEGADLAALEADLVAATQDPHALVRREAAGALGSWRLAADRFTSWESSPSPLAAPLAAAYARRASNR
jgi:thiol-disulfide isomerase/thioredoxin